jgi:hypothetical protein
MVKLEAIDSARLPRTGVPSPGGRLHLLTARQCRFWGGNREAVDLGHAERPNPRAPFRCVQGQGLRGQGLRGLSGPDRAG